MRILVAGASGYIASRAIPILLEAGHDIVATARTPEKLDHFWWRERVSVQYLDALEESSVESAISSDIEAVLYLIHGLGGDDFATNDRKAATVVRQAADRSGVSRIVYVSGIIPREPLAGLSEHLSSRYEVESQLNKASASVITLRAAMVMGSGSTSYALMSQLARRLPVTVLPKWMDSIVEPIAVSDLCEAISGAFASESGTCFYDVGGGTPLPYTDLISQFLSANSLERPRLEVPFLPNAVVGEMASRIADIPGPTARALIESLRDDMVADDSTWIGNLVSAEFERMTLDRMLEACNSPVDFLVPPSRRSPLSPLPGDATWAI